VNAERSLIRGLSLLECHQNIELSACAVRESWSVGRAAVLGVQLDRLDHQVKSVRAVDFARYAIGEAWRETEAFGEVQQTIHALGIAVQHEEHGAGAVFRPREQEQVIGAEVEHGALESGRRSPPAPIVSAVEGLARRTPPVGVIAQRGA